MATSPSHKLGQQIGNILESIFVPVLQEISNKNGLYLDVVGQDRKARKGKKITWEDAYGSTHDLDFVIEFGGSDTLLGRPVAFIESAWRRYTKHSKNKAQEIQGAVLPIASKYYVECPFKGAILAGEFTEPSLKQLRSSGFSILYIPYSDVVHAFSAASIDLAFAEDTPEEMLKQKVSAIDNMDHTQLDIVKDRIFSLNKTGISSFINALESKVKKVLKYVTVSPLYGHDVRFQDLDSARNFIQSYQIQSIPEELVFNTFIVHIEYLNGDLIKAELSDPESAISFLDKVLS